MPKILKDLNDKELVELIKDGVVGVLPTDTVYGLVCLASNEQAVKRLYALKKREKKPGTLIASSIEELVELGFKKRYLKAVEQYWPGSVSVVIPISDKKRKYLLQGKSDIAVRIANDKKLNMLSKKVGVLLTTSANAPGEPIATTIEEAREYFGNNVDFCVDGGDLSGKLPSTIIRIIDDEVEVLREGAVKI